MGGERRHFEKYAGVPRRPRRHQLQLGHLACAEGRRRRQAVSLLREMAMSTVKVVPDSTTYSLAIVACGKGGRWEEAVALLREMPSIVGVTPNVVQFGHNWR